MNLSSPEILLSVILLVELQLIVCLYLSYAIIRNMKEDIDYSMARIFLSQRSVKGMKVLMASLMSYAVLNLITVLGTTGGLFQFGVRANLLILFGGLAYFFRQISEVTAKTS